MTAMPTVEGALRRRHDKRRGARGGNGNMGRAGGKLPTLPLPQLLASR